MAHECDLLYGSAKMIHIFVYDAQSMKVSEYSAAQKQ